MYNIGTTRFNSKTWKENRDWCKSKGWYGCVYCTPKQITEKIPLNIPIIVLEMHNDKNKIMGIGLIKNAVVVGQYHKIYSEGNYNRYTYKSTYRIDREKLSENEEKIIKILDILLFKGKKHLKRGQGITIIPEWISNNKHINFHDYFKSMFNNHFSQVQP